MPQLCGMILQDPPRPLRDLRPDLPDALQAVIFRCLEKSRERRFANVADLAAALAPFGAPSAQRSADRISRVLGAAGIPSTPNLGVVANASTDANTSSNWGASQTPKKSRAPLFIALLAGLLVLGGGLMLVLQKRAAVESAAEPPVSAVVAPVLAQSAPMSTAAPAPPMVQPQLPASPSSASPVLSQAPEPVAAPAQGGPPPTHKAGAHAAAVKPAPAAPAAKPKPVAAQPAAPGIDPLDGRR
jgi:serine/threonine-protein kinase